MGIFSNEEIKTSITLYIDNLSNYEEIEWYQFQQLTESISMQPNGAREAIEAVRKKLKHGSTQQKLRVLEVLKLLMENSNQRFHRELITNEKMREKFEHIIDSPLEDIQVRKLLVSLLGTWATKFNGEQGMQILQQLYEKGRRTFREGQGSSAHHSPPTDIPTRNSSKNKQRVPPPPLRNQSQRVPPPNRIENQEQASSEHWDFEKAKPKIMQEVALSSQSANNLINALRLINTSHDHWEEDMKRDRNIQQLHQRCEEERKKIVRYARLVEDEEWIGTLLAANEELLRALDMYDIMLTGQIPAELVNRDTMPLSLLGPDSEEEDEDNIQLSRLRIQPKAMGADVLEDPFADPVDF